MAALNLEMFTFGEEKTEQKNYVRENFTVHCGYAWPESDTEMNWFCIRYSCSAKSNQFKDYLHEEGGSASFKHHISLS